MSMPPHMTPLLQHWSVVAVAASSAQAPNWVQQTSLQGKNMGGPARSVTAHEQLDETTLLLSRRLANGAPPAGACSLDASVCI